MLSKMENMISMMTTEKPFERLQSLELTFPGKG